MTKPRRKQRLMSTAETLRRSEEEFYGYNRDELRPRIKDECKSTPYLSSAEAEFKDIRLATRIHEWYRGGTNKYTLEQSAQILDQRSTPNPRVLRTGTKNMYY